MGDVEDRAVKLARLTTVGGSFAGHVLAARLVLLVDEVDAVLDLPPQQDQPRGAGLGFEPYAYWVVLVSIAMLGIVPIVRMALGT